MARRRYLITYDIADDKRRSLVFKTCQQEGDHAQYSVFIADFTDRELIRFLSKMEDVIHHVEDQILIADLGLADKDPGKIIASVGKAYEPPTRAIVV